MGRPGCEGGIDGVGLEMISLENPAHNDGEVDPVNIILGRRVP